MQKKDKNYLFLILAHILIGIIVSGFPFFSKIYGYSIIFLGLYFVVKTRNKNNEVLYASAYIVGSEVFLRMTDGNPNYEFAKYGVMVFLFLGMFYSGFSKNAVPYWIYLLLLVPSVIIATNVLNVQTNIRTTIAFNISGPVCLGVASLYTYQRKITIQEINNILLVMGLPIITCATYLFLFTVNLKDEITSTGSNGTYSGGFGPNQVATIMGLGMFVFVSRLIISSRSKIIFIVNLLLAAYISFRGLLTFSRGGMVTGIGMLLTFMLFVYFNSKYKGKVKLNYLIIFLGIITLIVWTITSISTNGLIENRYSNKDALGRVKKDISTGREGLAEGELNMFLENPIFGVGVAKGTEIRLEDTGAITASHDEITRMLAEHGSLGIIALLILLFTPIILYLDNKHNIYLFSFVIFWLFTINHAAMRTAAPSFIYALALLKVKIIPDEEPIIHRE